MPTYADRNTYNDILAHGDKDIYLQRIVYACLCFTTTALIR